MFYEGQAGCLPVQAAEKVDDIIDPIPLSIFALRFMSVAEKMRRSLQLTSASLSIKKRPDYFCAIFFA